MRPENVTDYYGTEAGRRVLLRHASALAITALALCAVFGDGRLDLAISRWFFDDARQAFALTNQWVLKTVLHDTARTAAVVAELTLVVLTVTSWWMGQANRFHAHRRELLFAASAALVGAAAVGTLKHFSAHACPWDLALFGGTAVYQPLFGTAATTPVIHGCSPAAHPLVGYAWLGVGFALVPKARRAAWQAWAAAFALGTGFGIVQVLRGAHFLSHVLWSGWIVWAVNVALLALWAYAPNQRRAQC
jgi:membrane-associated PAP2 superfamily phosphatase